MKLTRLGSILFSTAFVVAFVLLADPVIRPASRDARSIDIHEAAAAELPHAKVYVAAGKSLIVESSARIIRASVEDPNLARAVSIDEHEVLVNGKIPGRTSVTVWQEGNQQERFDLKVEVEPEASGRSRRRMSKRETGLPLPDAYRQAMDRIESAITGVTR